MATENVIAINQEQAVDEKKLSEINKGYLLGFDTNDLFKLSVSDINAINASNAEAIKSIESNIESIKTTLAQQNTINNNFNSNIEQLNKKISYGYDLPDPKTVEEGSIFCLIIQEGEI